jgi:hypothetical protein
VREELGVLFLFGIVAALVLGFLYFLFVVGPGAATYAKCPSCGRKMPKGAGNCPNCGPPV